MNVRDSEVVVGLLKGAGYKITDDHKAADIVIFNTCSVRQHAEDKVWSEIGRFKKSPVSGLRSPLIGVIGCMAQNYKEAIFERAPDVDFVVGPTDIDKIPNIIKKLDHRPQTTDHRLFETKIWETDGENRPERIYHTGFYEDREHAFVVISEGCSNFCSYCVVPYVRGPLRHRSHVDIIKEVKKAIDKGITKITLLGQNVNAYKSTAYGLRPTVDFIGLLKQVNGIKGLNEFSFVTSHPKDSSRELFKAMADLDKLKKYLHMPVQSGSDKVLKLMNRGYSRSFYLDLADNYRKIVQGGALTTDIIVGYPGETEKDFQDTYDLVEKVQFNAAYIFKYSSRPNTAAAKLVDDVPKTEKERRHREILELQKKISKAHK
ncbi:MAG: tRNA (N6-isopentenyl adenosine(37)-C2)-methylthiotransferase MiaB [Candidatus Omnitrophota bacterium]